MARSDWCTLNSGNELASSCRHRNKYLFANFKSIRISFSCTYVYIHLCSSTFISLFTWRLDSVCVYDPWNNFVVKCSFISNKLLFVPIILWIWSLTYFTSGEKILHSSPQLHSYIRNGIDVSAVWYPLKCEPL